MYYFYRNYFLSRNFGINVDNRSNEKLQSLVMVEEETKQNLASNVSNVTSCQCLLSNLCFHEITI